MEIKFTNKNLGKREIYAHTRASATSLKDVAENFVITPVEIVVYDDVNSKGETNTIMSIIDGNGEHFATNSKFFREELLYINDLMGDEPYDVIVKKPTSKGGRQFVTCELA